MIEKPGYQKYAMITSDCGFLLKKIKALNRDWETWLPKIRNNSWRLQFFVISKSKRFTVIG